MKNLASAFAVLAAIFALMAAFYRHKAKKAGVGSPRQENRLLGRAFAPPRRPQSAKAFALRDFAQAGYNAAAAVTWAAMAVIFMLASIAAACAG
jgi:hypothetical protein